MNNVIMIRSDYPDTRLEKEADSLIESGYNVSLIVWDRGRENAHLVSHPYQIKKLKLKVSPDSSKVGIYIPIWWAYIISQLVTERWDLVHAANFDSFLPALIVAKLKGKPIIYEMYDFYADFIGFPIFYRTSRAFFAWVDRFLMKFSDVIILADESRKEQIGLMENRNVVIITNSPRVTDLPNNYSHDALTSHNFTIFYGGNIGPDRGVDTMCQVVKNLSNVQLIIAGLCTESFLKKINSICQNATNIKNLSKTRWTSNKEIMKYTLESDLMFAFYDPSIPNNRYASPNKLFESMMFGKPIITNNGTSMADIVRKENCGLIVPYGDLNSIQHAILTLQGDPELCKQLGENGRKAYEQKYNWKIMERRLLDIYNEILVERVNIRKRYENT